MTQLRLFAGAAPELVETGHAAAISEPKREQFATAVEEVDGQAQVA